MRATDPRHTAHSRQRRRRHAAAVLCLGTLAVAAAGAFFAEHRAGAHGVADARRSVAPRTMPAPRPLPGGSAAYLMGTVMPLRSAALPLPATHGPRQSGGTTAVPSAVPSPPPVSALPGLDLTAQLAPQSVAAPMAVSSPLAGTAFSGLPQIGALFGYDGGATSSHFCSGSVVASDTGDIVITAAHCVYDASSGSLINDIAFVPGYHDGQQPYGVWTPSQIVVAPQWLNDQDPDYDVAFLVVHQPGSAQRIQDAVGADQLGVDSDSPALTQVVGYPIGTEQPITCTDYTKQFSSTQLEFDCPGYPEGTSGGPFLTDVDPRSGLGTVVGVIGGYETGGDSPDVSYSAYFGDSVAALFEQAQAAG